MKLKFEEVEKSYIDGVNANIDLATFVDNWMISKKNKETRGTLATRLGISITMLGIVETKINSLGVKLPSLKYDY